MTLLHETVHFDILIITLTSYAQFNSRQEVEDHLASCLPPIFLKEYVENVLMPLI
jgi:hypothetical protein